jgi:poly(3-hydroxybutyrate) depolymerase
MYDTTWDLIKLLDWLCAREDVAAERIGMTGISLGGMHTWFAACVDERVAAAAPLIGVQGYRHGLDTGQWAARVGSIQPFFDALSKELSVPIDAALVETVWQRLCPGLVDGEMAMDAPSSLQLIAPRPLLVANGEMDPRCPATGVREAVAAARGAYEQQGSGGQLQLHLEPGGGHEVTAQMWQLVAQFFETHLLLPTPTAAGRRAEL